MEIIDKNKVLMKNNLLIQARYNLTLSENKVFTLILYKLQKDHRGIYSCYLNQAEFKEILKKTQNTTIPGISRILNKLKHKDIFIREIDKNIWYDYTLIGGFSFDENKGIFKVEALPKIYDLLKDYYTQGYTPINLWVTLGMNNYYAQRLYDLLRLWSGTKEVVNYTIDYLKECLLLVGKYENYKDFKRRVILPAITELNETGYFEISIKENKLGRKVHSIDFMVKDMDKRKYFDKNIQAETEIPQLEEVNINPIFKPTHSMPKYQNNDTSEKFDGEISINTQVDKYNHLKIENRKSNDFFIPDETVFSTGTLRSFKKDFKDIDFTNEYMEKAFDDAIMITLDKDDVAEIKAPSYKFFKSTLENKIEEYIKEEIEDIEHKRNIEMYW